MFKKTKNSAIVGTGTPAAPSMTFTGDPDTGFFDASSNNTIGVATGGANIFNFTSTGLASPTAGGANITTAAGTAALPTYSFAGDTSTGWWKPAASTMAASMGGTERMRITSTGNVGIGTTSPSQVLDVVGTGKLSTGVITPKIYPASDSTTALQINKANGTTNILTVDTTNSRIGIGTQTPTANIGLGGDQTQTLGMERGTVAATAGYSLTINAGGATSGSTDKSGGDLVLSSGTGTGTGLSNILLKVPATGSTGTSDNAPTTIGTIYNLGMAVTGLVAATSRVYSGGASTAGGIYLMYGSAGAVSNFSIISGTGGTSNLAITDLKASAERIRITSTGSVGIGTTTPSYKLDVQGGDINASGSVRAAGVALTSDARFKKDIVKINKALDKICKIRGVSYNWRVDAFPEKQFNDRKQIGLIAQEVEQQFPEVIDIDKDGYKSINYPALVAPIIEAIKLLKDQIEDVKNKQSKIKNSCGCAQVRKNQKQSKASKQ